MKYLLIALALIVNSSLLAQDCNSLVTSEYDKVTGKTTISSIQVKDKSFSPHTGLEFKFYWLDSNSVALYINLVSYDNRPVMGHDEKAYFLFENDVRIEKTQQGDVNRNGTLTVVLTAEDIEKLKTLKLLTVRATSTKGYVERDLKKKSQTRIQDIVKCMFPE